MIKIFLPFLVILLSSSVQAIDHCTTGETDLVGCYPHNVDKDVLQANYEYLRQGYETIFVYYKRNEKYFKTVDKDARRCFFSLMCIDNAIRARVIGKKVFSAFDDFDKIKLFLTKHRDSPASDVEMHFFAKDYFEMVGHLEGLATNWVPETVIAAAQENDAWQSICPMPVHITYVT